MYHPRGLICLGQSQDLVAIENVRKVELNPVSSGKIGSTLIPFDFHNNQMMNGQILMLPEYYIYSENAGGLRKVGKIGRFIAISARNGYQKVEHENLFHIEEEPNIGKSNLSTQIRIIFTDT